MTGTVGASTPSPLFKPFQAVGNAVKKAVHAVDEYTSPRESTAGNFKETSYFQACVQAGVEGFYLQGLPGVAAGIASSAAGVFTENKTGSFKLGTVVGAASGVAFQVGVGLMTGAGPAALAVKAVAGGLLGLFFTMRGNSESATRDSAGNANMITATVMHGPAKLAGGIGAALGSKMESKIGKAVVGGITSAAIGGTLAAIGFTPVGFATAVAISGLAGAAGPFVGPRFSQFFRNLSNDIGGLVQKVVHKFRGEPETQAGKEKEERACNVVGALPSSFVKEGVRGFFLSDGGFSGFVIGGLMETVQQAQIFLCSKMEKTPSETHVVAPSTPAAPQEQKGQPEEVAR